MELGGDTISSFVWWIQPTCSSTLSPRVRVMATAHMLCDSGTKSTGAHDGYNPHVL